MAIDKETKIFEQINSLNQAKHSLGTVARNMKSTTIDDPEMVGTIKDIHTIVLMLLQGTQVKR